MSDREETSDEVMGSGISLDELREAAGTTSPEEFEDQYGSAFLVLASSDLEIPDGPGATVVELPEQAAGAIAAVEGRESLAHPVRQTGRSVGHLISAGRTSNNDIVIPDASVSRFHAYFKQLADGHFQVQDAGSTNGTSVNGEPAPPRGEGARVSLKSGDRVEIGQIGLRFFEAAELRERLLRGR